MKEIPERTLQVIYKLSKVDPAVKSIAVAKELGITRPDVFRALKGLKTFGYIDQKPYGKLNLTEKGRARAEKMLLLHQGMTQVFTQTAGLTEAEAAPIIYSVENVLSEEAVNKIIRTLRERGILPTEE